MTRYFDYGVLMANLDAVMAEIALDIKPSALKRAAEFILFIFGIALDNLKHEICKPGKFDLGKHVGHSVSVVPLYQ